MYDGSIAPISNREDWIFQSALTDDDGTEIDLTNATIKVFLCAKGNSSSALLSAETTFTDGTADGDDEITLPTDTSFQFQFPPDDVGDLCPGVYNVFVRITIDETTTQLISGNVTVLDGGPA
jgi:hypothetical protein